MPVEIGLAGALVGGTRPAAELADIAHGHDEAAERGVPGNGLSARHDRRALFGLGGYSGPLTARISWCGQPARSYGALSVDRYHVLRQAEDP